MRQTPFLVTIKEQFVQKCVKSHHPQTKYDEEYQQGKNETVIWAHPINKRLPTFQVEGFPIELVQDKRKGRDLGHRYYIAKFVQWN